MERYHDEIHPVKYESEMNMSFRQINITAPLLGLLITLAGPVSAQDLGPSMLMGLGESLLSEGEDLLNNAPSMLDEMLRSAEKGQTYASSEACLGALQVAVNAGVVAANVLPFSTVHIFEDDRGPVGRFRMLMNGQKLHLDAFCVDRDLSATLLPWGEGTPEPVVVSRSSFDATAGLLLLLQAQGAFVKDEPATPAFAAPETPMGRSAPGATNDLIAPPPTTNNTVSDALSNALEPIPGPPMTSAERDAFRSNVQQCWNVGSLSPEAIRTTVIVTLSLTRDGRPVPDSIRLKGFEGGDEEAVRQAFESAQRAIIRCGKDGFKMPADKYQQWKNLVWTFNPENMRIR